ncbi:MBL fold metallo-hydrolase [Verticiella sediminum]|uniref:MBL fold metallo-hydrolase n=1 Tax=Verticiella sediminum TaxID=1247510 RepID=A0A556A7G5_9BURK|nr:alkyl sulfatase dimerization domain-containing protein [Verticiella sediminum]TSH88833.1 MBL fold metallo-hydrolase [Verticiella sediminum]
MSTTASPKDDAAFLVTKEGLESVADGIHVLHGQGQSLVVELPDSLLLVDTGPGGKVTRGMIAHLREHLPQPLGAIAYSHGHIGYNAGLPLWLADAAERGHARPRVIAHANVPRRYARYRATMPLQERMAEMQFRTRAGALRGKLPVHDPDEGFDDVLVLGEGERQAHLLWAPSETDDAISVWMPHQRILYGGPAVLDNIPNIGTPLRTLRHTLRWADTLEKLAALRPRLVIREFGPHIVGEDEVQTVLGGTARALRWLHAEVIRLLNEGLGERELLARLEYPPELFEQPWMKPTYGDPDFIARDIYRSENGWWDRNATSLHPAPPPDVAAEIGKAIQDKGAVLAHARALAERGELQLALHVVDLLATASGEAPEFAEARALKAQWLRERARQVPSYVSRSLYHASANMLEDGSAAAFSLR